MPLLVAGIGVVLVARRRPGRTALAIVALGAAGALLADVLLSHAAAGSNAAVDVAVQALHVIAVGLWLGGLAGLLLTIGRTADERTARAARRFSWLATIGIATVAVTGLLRAIAEVGTVDALLTSDFGHLVIAKTALLAMLAVLGAVNHFRNVPAAGRTLARPAPGRVGRAARRRDGPPPDGVARQPRAAGRGRGRRLRLRRPARARRRSSSTATTSARRSRSDSRSRPGRPGSTRSRRP